MAFITEIQGSRVMFKGCTLGCQDCPTPELQSFLREIVFERELCIGCRRCIKICQRKALQMDGNGIALDREKCVSCGRCALVCPNQAFRAAGRNYGVSDLVRRLTEEAFDRSVVLSGGEVLAVDEQYLAALIDGLSDAGISVGIDTCGFRDDGKLEKIIEKIETFTCRRKK